MTSVGDPYTPAVIGSYSPVGSASTDGGDSVVITGPGFTDVTNVAFGTHPAYFEVISDTEIHATAPAYNPAVTSPDPAKVSVWKDLIGSDTNQLTDEWTWGGQTPNQIQTASGT